MPSNGTESDEFAKIISNYYLNLTICICICLFIAFIAHPLYKLGTSRIALLIIISKSIGTFINNVISIGDFILPPLNNDNIPFLWNYMVTWNLVPNFSVRLHLLALALNRVHCVFFPFHYVKLTKKCNILKFSCFLWLLSILLAAGNIFLPKFASMEWICFIFQLTTINQICGYGALCCYLLMTSKLLWLKFHRNSTTMDSPEKDHIRICLACLASVVPFLLNMLPTVMIDTALYQGSSAFQDSLLLIALLANTVAQIGEEFCLLAVCAEFRQFIWADLQKVVCKTPRKEDQQNGNEIGLQVTRLSHHQQQRTLSMNAITSRN